MYPKPVYWWNFAEVSQRSWLWIPFRRKFFSGFKFTTVWVVSITGMINRIFISFRYVRELNAETYFKEHILIVWIKTVRFTRLLKKVSFETEPRTGDLLCMNSRLYLIKDLHYVVCCPCFIYSKVTQYSWKFNKPNTDDVTPEKTMLSRYLSNPVMFVPHGKAVASWLNTSLKFVSIHLHRHTGIYQQSEKQNEKLSYMTCCRHCAFEPKCRQNCKRSAP